MTFHSWQSLLLLDGLPRLSLPVQCPKVLHDQERDLAEDLRSLSVATSTAEASYHSHAVQTLAKWSTKIQAVAPSVLLPSGRTFSNAMSGGRTAPTDVIDAIEAALRLELQKPNMHARLVQSSNIAGSLEDCINSSSARFDDTNFYRQLLRDVIDSRGIANEGSVDQQGWAQQQKALRARRKKNVDTRASKGRKLRYQVHEKLQNFMMPVENNSGTWHAEQVDELFATLLGINSYHS